MSLNPVKFGKDVIDQFGRYLRNSYPIADELIAAQFNEKMGYTADSLIAKGPYIYLNKPFVEGAKLETLITELGLHRTLSAIFKFPIMYSHQEKAVRAVIDNKNVIVSTGTGSGKTESFLLPIIDYCLKSVEKSSSENKSTEGLAAILIYPMNALVNDQLERLRPMLAGTGITFGRYTGETPQNSNYGLNKLTEKRAYTAAELEAFYDNKADLPLPYEECYSRDEIVEKRPKILLTNYSQLEYLLLRDKDLELFKTPALKFIVLDEVHTYTGELGSEMACLIRRIKSLMHDKITCIGTSATVANTDSAQVIRNFAAELFGEEKESFAVIEEEYKKSEADEALLYCPDITENIENLLNDILDEVKKYQLSNEVNEIGPELVILSEKLTGRKVGDNFSKNIDRLGELLINNKYLRQIENIFSKPSLPSDSFLELKKIGNRVNAKDNELEAELLSYLTIGAIAKYDNEPVLRPKLHYFVKGISGVNCVIEKDDKIRLYFDDSYDKDLYSFNFKICRNCGQHFFNVVSELEPVSENGVGVINVLRNRKNDEMLSKCERGWLITDNLNELDEDSTSGETGYVCKYCGCIHINEVSKCLNPKCKKANSIVRMELFDDKITKCPSCSALIKTGQYSLITGIYSPEVLDVMILGQSMISAMPERILQKLLIFADSRQDAAFQAAWMNARSKRFNVRFINYNIIDEFKSDFDEAMSYDRLIGLLSEETVKQGVYSDTGFKKEEHNKRIRWFLIDEFMSVRQRSSLEKLGLVSVVYDGINYNNKHDEFFKKWASKLGADAANLINTVVLMLDYLRKKGAVNDDLAKRLWRYTDSEVRDGIIPNIENYRPGGFVFQKDDNLKQRNYIKSFLSSNGRSGIEVIFKKALGLPKTNAEFFEALWELLVDNGIFKESRLIEKRHGNLISLIRPETQRIYQINKDILGFKKAGNLFKCKSCKNVMGIIPLSGKCTQYNCKGDIVASGIDGDNYDIIQFTKLNYTPIKSEEHSAQVPKAERGNIEKEFKKIDSGKCNCLVATPTLELGVDIGKLEMVLMRNVPPATPNYTQRAGRAGRKHRIATVFTYSRCTSHDSYFYNNPAEMITGNIRVPVFSMRNKPLVTKHIHSMVLTWLRSNAKTEDIQTLKLIFPSYIKSYFANSDQLGHVDYKNDADDFSNLKVIINNYLKGLVDYVTVNLIKQWPDDDRDEINSDFIREIILEMPDKLSGHVKNIFLEINTYRNLLKPLREKEFLNPSDKKRMDSLRYALQSYHFESQDNYALSYLSADGFFPSYAMGRASVKAQCTEPFLELSRPKAMAIRELTPANMLYANHDIFKVTQLNFFKLREKSPDFNFEMIRKTMILNKANSSLTEGGQIKTQGGDNNFVEFGSYDIIDVILSKVNKIDDVKESRHRIGFTMYAMMNEKHKGGREYKINGLTVKYLNQGNVRLVNGGICNSPVIGFPICPACGAVRHPLASDEEIKDFISIHTKKCQIRDPRQFWSALHADISSDLIVIDEFEELKDAVNFMESLKYGAYRVLDMQENDLDGVIETKPNGKNRVIIYDPLPGGSGFLAQFLKYYVKIVNESIKKLKDCDCDDSCYSCLLHFRNQQHHKLLNRFDAIKILGEHQTVPVFTIEIPSVVANSEHKRGDSEAEDQFIVFLKGKNFPVPDKSLFKVELAGGDYTVTDYAYEDKKILIYIDGLSRKLHGNFQQKKNDSILRAKAKLKGYSVIEISAQGLKDEEYMNAKLEEISLYLNN